MGEVFGNDDAPRSIDLEHVGSIFDVRDVISQNLTRRIFRIRNTHTSAQTKTTTFDIDSGSNVTEVLPAIGVRGTVPQHMLVGARVVTNSAPNFTSGSLSLTTLLSSDPTLVEVVRWDEAGSRGTGALANSPTAMDGWPIFIFQGFWSSTLSFQTISGGAITTDLILETVTGPRVFFPAYFR